MAASVSINVGPEVPGSRKEVFGVVTFDSSYPTGGEAISVADLGFTRLDWLDVSATNGYHPAWDGSLTAPKIKVFYADYNAESDGALIEVPNTTDLSTVTVRFRATGA
jgi:hypothetical protein